MNNTDNKNSHTDKLKHGVKCWTRILYAPDDKTQYGSSCDVLTQTFYYTLHTQTAFPQCAFSHGVLNRLY